MRSNEGFAEALSSMTGDKGKKKLPETEANLIAITIPEATQPLFTSTLLF
jgi:hypothetical protein